MESPYVPILWTLSAAVMTAFLGNVFIAHLRHRKTFALPIVGAGTGDINALKERYVKEADVLLREGYERVSDSWLLSSRVRHLIDPTVREQYISGYNSRRATRVPPEKVRP
jgi:hypothetical protein